MTTILVTPHRFADLEPERETLEPLGANVVAAGDIDELLRLAGDAEALLVTSFVTVGADLISRLRRCRAIVRYGIGVNEVDIAAATAAGIPVGNVLDASVEEVADHAVLLALACLRRLGETQRSLAGGSWGIGAMRDVRRLSTLSAGILGLGRIGNAVARRLEPFGFDVLAYDPFVTEAMYPLLDLDAVLSRADVLFVHLPLTEDTRGLLSDTRLALLPHGAVVVNVSRGGIVDENALLERIDRGALGGAGLDVFEQEPLPADHPLRASDHVVATPHVAWYSGEASRDLQWGAAQQVARVLRGERLDPVVNPVVYERFVQA
ncbi:MAG TPA: C-terminal binding protein [Gaiellaceae bacterium]|nr:C-terminal binding protein [Gaiellaceae bacterium]